MNPAILHKEVQDFITANYAEALSKLVLQGSPFKEVSTKELATQLSGKKKARKKLPSWFQSDQILYPPTLNLEQASSEATAAYKASLLQGKALADITGGFGIDTYYFSKVFEKVYHCELNADLSQLVAHNLRQLGATNVECIAGNGIRFLEESTENLDCIYLDPSRRSDSGGRVFRLSDCQPDVPAALDLLFSRAGKIMLKTSPLLDLQAGLRELVHVKEIHIIAVDNEVKELLWILEKGDFPLRIKTLNLQKSGQQRFEAVLGSPAELEYSTPLAYLYEPNAALMKSGLFEALGHEYKLGKLHPNTHLFTADRLLDFPGRRFKVLEKLPFNRRKIKRQLDFEKAHISTRNFPESVASLRKQLKLKDGGDRYLFFTTGPAGEKLLLICGKV